MNEKKKLSDSKQFEDMTVLPYDALSSAPPGAGEDVLLLNEADMTVLPYDSLSSAPPGVGEDVLLLDEVVPQPQPRDGAAELKKSARKLAKRASRGVDPRDPQTKLLAQTVVLEEAGTSRYTRVSLYLGASLVIATIGWAGVTRLDEVATGPGEIVPSGSVKVVQHLEGGIVSEINIEDGSLVKKGQVLIRLRKEQASAELRQLKVREAALTLRAGRLFEFVTGKKSGDTNQNMQKRYASMAREEVAILKLQTRARSLQRAVIEAQIAQRNEKLKTLLFTQQSLKKQFVALKEAYELRQEGVRRGVVARALFLQTKREYERAVGELNETTTRLDGARKELLEAKAKLAEFDVRVRSDALAERGKLLSELAQVKERLVRLRDRVKRLEIRSPVSGYVKGLRVHTVGAVITNDGKPIMEIVPNNSKLLVKARISTRDIGHLKIGQTVKVKVDTYDFARFGSIPGTLRSLSATTFLDKDGRPYYRAIVKLSKSWVGNNPRLFPVTPGMTVSTEVITGTKSLLAYILKPVYVAVNGGFRER
jgi:adhesin transport system membrane fusion protein